MVSDNFPFPTLIELIRVVSRSLDLRKEQKNLDNGSKKRLINPGTVERLLVKAVDEPLKEMLGDASAGNIIEDFKLIKDDYLKLVGQVAADGLSRDELIPALIEHFFSPRIAKLIGHIYRDIEGPDPSALLVSNGSSVSISLDWLSEHHAPWQYFLKGLTKEQKDRIGAWSRSNDLPLCQSIKGLDSWDKNKTSIEWNKVKTLLLLSRAIDELRREDSGEWTIELLRLQLWDAVSRSSIENEIEKLQKKHASIYAPIYSHLAEVQHRLMRTKEKDEGEQVKLFDSLEHIESFSKQHSLSQHSSYWLSWHRARWYVFAGDIGKANQFYKLAFEDSLYRSGANQKVIIEEALVIASCQKKPDKSLLRKLKWAQLTFGYDIPSVDIPSPSGRFEDAIEEWEVDMWRGNFERTFPKKGWFDGTSIVIPSSRVGPLLFASEDTVKPDYQNPDRAIKVGDSWQKKIPQLVWFTDMGNYDVVSRLLEKGARVNVQSDVGDTSILMAIEALNVADLPFKSLDRRFFDLLSQYTHRSEIINLRTQKKRLLPIISAVESGQLDVVEKVLELGALPDRRGLTDNQTALNVCIKRIGMLKNPALFWKNQFELGLTPEVLDSIRRQSAGMFGFTLEQQAASQISMQQNPKFRRIVNLIVELYTERVEEHLSLNEMRSIAALLINKGADVNAVHKSPVNGYTPLMLAAELDELDLFELMLSKGGNTRKTYLCSNTGTHVDCWGNPPENPRCS